MFFSPICYTFAGMNKLSIWILCLLAVCLSPSDMVADGWLDEAYSFLGKPYVAGTLEREGGESLVVDTLGFDCTTFVELSVARWLSRCNDTPCEDELRKMRYRGGVVDGYLSRLHYFTDWVTENERRGVWRELNPDDGGYWRRDTFSLSFMSEHCESYRYLQINPWAIDSMRRIEQRYTDYVVHYIAKEFLNLSPKQLPIHHGDILALVTTIEGLDVTHLGFAFWQDEQLYLMHASMNEKRVVIDKQTLYEYLKNRVSCPGVRVVRLRQSHL